MTGRTNNVMEVYAEPMIAGGMEMRIASKVEAHQASKWYAGHRYMDYTIEIKESCDTIPSSYYAIIRNKAGELVHLIDNFLNPGLLKHDAEHWITMRELNHNKLKLSQRNARSQSMGRTD